MKKNKCHILKYNVIDGNVVTYGFRCRHYPSLRYHTEEKRDLAIKIHRKNQKKKSKQK